MKTNKTNLIRKIRSFIFFPMLALTVVLLYSFVLHSSEARVVLEITQQEKITVIGKVLDTNSNSIDGVMVKDKKGDAEVISDTNGKFTLSLNEPTVVSFTKFGFQTLEKEIAENDSNLIVILTPESNELIVGGFGSKMNGNKDNKWILDSLSSVIDNSPLYIIDDIQKENDFNVKTLNPNDVVSIEMLPDSIAEDRYGAEGQGGAVIITTNKGVDLDNQIPMQLNKDDSESASSILKDKYEVYKDSMNARNDRLHKRIENKRKETTMMKKMEKLPMDSVDRLGKMHENEKMENLMDTTTMKGVKDTVR
ncbi:MAG: carboxypeptidase-like regulatory domain-containing protein [Dysgonamonadaceae bacterium]|jgi:hypothetical protein|nr:hypothetical protein [Dysgonamonadaceae bacterium]MDD3356477.1 hypothetical protein [Dysgonamonadaceae bacterium]MDD3728278.1 hypothetical protein [Dysgonamonadaceae bacterium]MDD4605559.1 hypothetical protein [Dysgonamonadaceae bacterium]HUI33010.1 carboxypeptidase-like regulatory domain-containing protein [Dysgonamonadaceae bacterium]